VAGHLATLLQPPWSLVYGPPRCSHFVSSHRRSIANILEHLVLPSSEGLNLPPLTPPTISVAMDSQSEATAALFDVYLRLRPSLGSEDDQFLDVEPSDNDSWPKHITIRPPVNDHRKRAVEKFAFTRVFGEESSQLDIFHGTEVSQLITGVLGCEGRPRNGLLATLGVTGSGKVCQTRAFDWRLIMDRVIRFSGRSHSVD